MPSRLRTEISQIIDEHAPIFEHALKTTKMVFLSFQREV